jgi:hypothetical protein
VHSYVFSRENERFHIFFAVSENMQREASDVAAVETWGRARRFQVVLRGERKIGYRVIETATNAGETPLEARERFRGLLADLIRVPAPASVPEEKYRDEQTK